MADQKLPAHDVEFGEPPLTDEEMVNIEERWAEQTDLPATIAPGSSASNVARKGSPPPSDLEAVLSDLSAHRISVENQVQVLNRLVGHAVQEAKEARREVGELQSQVDGLVKMIKNLTEGVQKIPEHINQALNNPESNLVKQVGRMRFDLNEEITNRAADIRMLREAHDLPSAIDEIQEKRAKEIEQAKQELEKAAKAHREAILKEVHGGPSQGKRRLML